MPEGDTIFRAAKLLRAALEGRPLTGFDTPRPVPGRPPEPGEAILEVTSRGKHLLGGSPAARPFTPTCA